MMMTTLFACLCVVLVALTNAQVDSNVTLSTNDSGELELDYDYDEQSLLDLLTKIDSV